MSSRRVAREVALQSLYLIDTCKYTPESAIQTVLQIPLSKPLREFVNDLVNGVTIQKPEIDAILSGCLENWNMKRLAIVDRNILRLATYEIINDKDTPISVILNEAIEIAKLYSTEDSSKFVNGILDKVKSERK